MIKEITSINNPTIVEFIKLKDKKYREEHKQFIIEGYHLVEEASKSHLLKCVLSTNEEDLSKYNNIDCYKVNSLIINKLSSTVNPQPIIGIVSFIDKQMDILNNSKNVVILDNINDPGNMGTIIRTSAALGYDTILLSKDCVDIYNEKVIRASQGSLFKLNIVINDLEESINILKKNNIMILATSLNASVPLNEISKLDKFAIIFGNEAHGVRDNILKLSDKNIIIPMKQDVESLNVSVAAGIVMYELKNTLR